MCKAWCDINITVTETKKICRQFGLQDKMCWNLQDEHQVMKGIKQKCVENVSIYIKDLPIFMQII